MMHLLPQILQQFFDANGNPLVAGKVHTYAAGTSTPLATYKDASGTENTNPIILDANGVADIWVGALAYKFVITDANDVPIKTIDDVSHISNGSVTTAKIANGAVTNDKLATDAVSTSKIIDQNVTTAKIQDSAVTTVKINNAAVTTAKIEDEAVTTAKIDDGAVTLPKLADSTLQAIFPTKNKFINGGLSLWTRGSLFNGLGGTYCTADRWRFDKAGTSSIVVERSTNVPTVAQAGHLIDSSMAISVSFDQTSLGAAHLVAFGQWLEGYTFRSIAQQPTTASFWVYSSKTGTYCAALQNGTNPADQSYIVEFEVNAASVWEKKVINLPPTPATGTWHLDSRPGLGVSFVLAAGSDFIDTADSWISGRKYATSNQVNFTDSTSNTFYVADLQLEAGVIATNFEERPYGMEAVLAERFCEEGEGDFRAYNPNVAATGAIGGMIQFRTAKRIPNGTVSITDDQYNTRVNNGSIADFASEYGVPVAADFITAGGAGPATFYCKVLVDAEIYSGA